MNSDEQGAVILGAGLAGLGCARHLPGAKVFEAHGHPGGHACSRRLGGFSFDEGAHISHSRDPRFLEMIYRAAGDVRQISPSAVQNYRKGRWLTYPVQDNLFELEPVERTRALNDFVRSQIGRADSKPQNYSEWCVQQYGAYLTEEFYSRYTRKYWRVPMAELSTDWLSGRLLPAQVEKVVAGSIGPSTGSAAVFTKFHYPRSGGFFRFFEELYKDIQVQYHHVASEVDIARKVISFSNGKTSSFDVLASSIPLPKLISIIPQAPEDVRNAAELLKATQLLCVNLVVGRPNLSKLHWFYIYDEEIQASRVSVVSNLGNEVSAATATALQIEIFRGPREEFSAPELVDEAIDSISAVLGFTRSEVTQCDHFVVPHAYVLSDKHRAAASALAIAWLRRNRIFPMGLFGKWKYVWSDAAFTDGVETAQEIVRTLRDGNGS